ncbi:MAG: SgcJ/EcaC family oxidoreductase [Verrucomicrobiota bacterium]|nr:SgcJ/EcaC family oxidoreductase [Verrucomicrobiota bacterium]
MTLLLIVTSSGINAADLPTQLNDEKSIHALLDAFGQAFAKLDAHAFSMVFHEDADFTNVWGMTAHGRQTIEDFHRPLLEGDGAGMIPSFKRAEFKILETRIRFLRPDVAFVDVTWTQTGAVQNGRDMGPRKGLLMLVATQEGGKWGIAVMHNMDLPPAK